VEAGKLADVIAVNGNPLEDITLMQHVGFVMKDGVVYKEAGTPVMPLAQEAPLPTTAQGEELSGY
jgi:exopolysaccharide biosynthesis protein